LGNQRADCLGKSFGNYIADTKAEHGTHTGSQRPADCRAEHIADSGTNSAARLPDDKTSGTGGCFGYPPVAIFELFNLLLGFEFEALKQRQLGRFDKGCQQQRKREQQAQKAQLSRCKPHITLHTLRDMYMIIRKTTPPRNAMALDSNLAGSQF
jgi:hypothetical protein